MLRQIEKQPGDWLSSHPLLDKWILRLKANVQETDPSEYHLPVRKLYNMVMNDPVLKNSTEGMFVEAIHYNDKTGTGGPAVASWKQFLDSLNALMNTAPHFVSDDEGNAKPHVASPITALLDWPMGTASGFFTFSNAKFNQYFKEVLQYWCAYLLRKESRYVLAEGDESHGLKSIPWLSEPAKKQMVEFAQLPFKRPSPYPVKFEDIYLVPDKNDPKYLGFKSWDAFFTREFRKGQRPVGRADIVSACESAPLLYKKDVPLTADVNLKGQPYSVKDMLNNDPLAQQFAGGTVYQAFLSSLSYHRWHSPVDGTVEKAFIVDGTYYLRSPTVSVYCEDHDRKAPTNSQRFITSVATRAVIFIRADKPTIGVVAVVPVGMGEVSSCEITVEEGQHVNKGDEIGMFHFGGSTHCLVFQRGVEIEFLVKVTEEPNVYATNVAVKSDLAKVKSCRFLNLCCSNQCSKVDQWTV